MLEPNRNYVIEEDGSIHKMLFSGDADWEERATTSIQEIRNNAIDEFAEALKTKCDEMSENEWNKDVQPLSWADAYEDFKDDIDEIAEQLKGGATNEV